MRDAKVAQHFISLALPAPLLLLEYNITSFPILDDPDLIF